jgi:SAM-dependent methyltransferase
MSAADVVWHDVECGGYDADVSLWIELAQDAPEGVLDVGAGTGRVALRLAQAGFDVTALDIDPELLAALERRAAKKGVEITTLAADANDFELPQPVGLIAVPMQTIQLLPERGGFFASARRALVTGGRVAVAIATELDPYDGSPPLPVPDFGESDDGSAYISQPVAIRVYEDYVEIERIRQIVSPEGERTSAGDLIRLAVVTPGELAEEAAAHGLEAEELLHIPETLEHVASQVVVFRG